MGCVRIVVRVDLFASCYNGVLMLLWIIKTTRPAEASNNYGFANLPWAHQYLNKFSWLLNPLCNLLEMLALKHNLQFTQCLEQIYSIE